MSLIIRGPISNGSVWSGGCDCAGTGSDRNPKLHVLGIARSTYGKEYATPNNKAPIKMQKTPTASNTYRSRKYRKLRARCGLSFGELESSKKAAAYMPRTD